MSWNGGAFGANTISERAAALRDRAEAERQHTQQAIERSQEMAKRPKSPTGILRAQLPTKEARSAVGSANRKIDEGLDEVRLAFQREAQASDAEQSARASESGRAPALSNPRSAR